MIFYTLQGPTHELQIYDDKIRLVKRPWTKLFTRRDLVNEWQISALSHFEITAPKFFIFSGKLQWSTFEGAPGTFRFSTNGVMVKKIETYLQKRVLKNHQRSGEKEVRPSKKAPLSKLAAA